MYSLLKKEAGVGIDAYTHAETCLTLCNSKNCCPPGSSVHETF